MLFEGQLDNTFSDVTHIQFVSQIQVGIRVHSSGRCIQTNENTVPAVGGLQPAQR